MRKIQRPAPTIRKKCFYPLILRMSHFFVGHSVTMVVIWQSTMRLSLLFNVLFGLSTVSLASSCFAGEPIPLKSVHNTMEQDRLAAFLHVAQFESHCVASKPYRAVEATIDCFRDGKKVESKTASLICKSIHESVTVKLQNGNLGDLLPASEDSTHMHCWLNIETDSTADDPSSFAMIEVDIPKTAFDVSRANGKSHWPKSDPNVDGSYPLYWLMRVTNGKVVSGSSPEALIKANPGADILILSVKLSDRSE
jgi:hypothetical protein